MCSNEPGYVDEADRFMAHPVSFLYSMYSSQNSEELPSHIVLFDSMEQRVSMFLKMEGFTLVRCNPWMLATLGVSPRINDDTSPS